MKVLIVDREPMIAEMTAFAFRREGFQVFLVHDGITAIQTWAYEKPDLVILEVDLPQMDGFTVCQRIRKESRIPVIFLSSRAEEEAELQGLALGADAYLTKPFSPRQLVARARAILRRTSPTANKKLLRNRFALDSKRFEDLERATQVVSLAPLEKRLLEYFLSNSGKVLTYESIIRHVWGTPRVDRDTLRHLIRRLRTKIEPDPANPTTIKTVPGFGYALEEQTKAI
jgi:two-component system response regulator RegX3